MKNPKKTFILHNDSLIILDKLSDQQAGQLFKAIRLYNIGQQPEMDQLIEILFHPFKIQFDRNAEAYEKECEKNSTNGALGGRPKKPTETQPNPKNPVGYLETQPKQKKLDSDSDSDKENIIGTGSKEPANTKINNLEERRIEFYKSLIPYKTNYPPTTLREFYDYWSETNKSQTKMKWELERTFELQKRLVRWANNDKSAATKGAQPIDNPYNKN